MSDPRYQQGLRPEIVGHLVSKSCQRTEGSVQGDPRTTSKPQELAIHPPHDNARKLETDEYQLVGSPWLLRTRDTGPHVIRTDRLFGSYRMQIPSSRFLTLRGCHPHSSERYNLCRRNDRGPAPSARVASRSVHGASTRGPVGNCGHVPTASVHGRSVDVTVVGGRKGPLNTGPGGAVTSAA